LSCLAGRGLAPDPDDGGLNGIAAVPRAASAFRAGAGLAVLPCGVLLEALLVAGRVAPELVRLPLALHPAGVAAGEEAVAAGSSRPGRAPHDGAGAAGGPEQGRRPDAGEQQEQERLASAVHALTRRSSERSPRPTARPAGR
jgi:hypothetical protein